MRRSTSARRRVPDRSSPPTRTCSGLASRLPDRSLVRLEVVRVLSDGAVDQLHVLDRPPDRSSQPVLEPRAGREPELPLRLLRAAEPMAGAVPVARRGDAELRLGLRE